MPDDSPSSDKRILIVTDGCQLNAHTMPRGIGAWACITIEDGRRTEHSGTSTSASSMEMEVQAVINALDRLPKNAPVHLITDIFSISQTLHRIRKRQQEGKDPSTLFSKDSIWSPLAAAFVEHTDITCEVRRSHSVEERDPLQKDVHKLCSKAAKELQKSLLGSSPDSQEQQRF